MLKLYPIGLARAWRGGIRDIVGGKLAPVYLWNMGVSLDWKFVWI